MHKTVVLNVVGLTADLVRRAAPKIADWSRDAAVVDIRAAFPAVTCTAQSDYLTGRYPEVHGVVGNGWYTRDDCEIRFWRQSNKLVQAPKVWDAAKAADPSFTCANLFWWFNMYSTVDYSVTPRPMYLADGRKLPDIYTHPDSLREDLQTRLGTFPLFDFWGPRASIASSRWIAEAAKIVERQFNPTLTLVYLPHLDYNLQRVGPGAPAAVDDVGQADELCAKPDVFLR
jgi:predicted AlkP superfamily pyrophosphatase or phosphodiesterase